VLAHNLKRKKENETMERDVTVTTLESMPMDSGDKGLGIGAGILEDLAALEQRWPQMPEGGWTVAEDCYGHVAGKIRDQIKATLAVANNADPTQGEDAHVAKAQAAAEKLAEAVSEAEKKLVQAEIDSAVALSEAFDQHDGLTPSPYAQEIRSVVRGLSETEKVTFLKEMMDKGDGAILGSLLKVPSILTGIDQATKDSFLETWRARTCPSLIARRERCKEALANARAVLEFGQMVAQELRGTRSITNAMAKARQAEERLAAGQ